MPLLLVYVLIFLLFFSCTHAMLETYFKLSILGMEYLPQDESALLLATSYCTQYQQCAQACSLNYACRIFDYDSASRRCRLFEGDLKTVGSMQASNSSFSKIGQVVINPALFSAYGQSCSFCMYNRYLMCINNTCGCLGHTYWTGSICATQQLLGGQCTNSSQCWYSNHTCLRYFQCGRK